MKTVPQVFAAASAIAALAVAGHAAAEPARSATTPEKGAPLTQRDLTTWLDDLVPAELQKAGVAGAAVTVVHDGRILTSQGYGYADVEARVPVDPEKTLFRMGSVSKTVTATAVMQLVESGRLDLDADIARYVDFEVERSFSDDITLRHLLTHTAGYEDTFPRLIPKGTEGELRGFVADHPPEQVYRPGTTPAYSNYSYALAGYIVERVSAKPFEEYVEDTVLEPLGMTSSTFEQPLPTGLETRLSHGYPTVTEPPSDFERIADVPSGALTASPTDIGRFMLAHLGEQEVRDFLGIETLATMHRPALDSDSLGMLAGANRMTLGFAEADRNGHRVLGQDGDTRVFHSELRLYPDQDTGIFVTMNSSGNVEPDVREVVLNGFADRYFPGRDPGGRTAEPTASARQAEAVEGSYVDAKSVHSNFLAVNALANQTRITARENGTILVDRREYEPVAPWVWREVDGHRMLAADVVGGEVRAVGATAFTYLPAGAATRVAVPVLLSSLGALVVANLSWPIAAVVRRLSARPRRDPARRWPRVLTRVALAATVLAYVAWVAVVMRLMQFHDVPFEVLRLVQAVQVVGALGVVPAAMVVISNRRHGAGWARILGSTLVLVSLLGCAWFAVSFGLLAPSVSY